MVDPEVIARIAERKIQEAIEEGKFDNLPGKGKPLVFDEDPTTPAHLRMANRVLKNAGVLPDWIQVQKDILAERQEVVAMRTRLARENQTRRARVEALALDHPLRTQYNAWHARSRAGYLRRLKSVNTFILKFCMIAPSTSVPFNPYRIEAEMAAFDEDFPPVDGNPAVPVPEEDGTNRLRSLARESYQRGGALRVWIRGRQSASSATPNTLKEAGDMGRADLPGDAPKP